MIRLMIVLIVLQCVTWNACALPAAQGDSLEELRRENALLRDQLEKALKERDAARAPAEGHAKAKPHGHGGAHAEPSDLHIKDFFRKGWNEDWTHRPETPDRARRLALLRVNTAFMEREFRMNFVDNSFSVYQARPEKTQFEAFYTWAFCRRFQLNVQANEEWDELRPARGVGPNPSGTTGALLMRFQLEDDYRSCAALNAKLTTANKGVGESKHTLALSVGGFQDLTKRLGINKLAFYWDVRYNIFFGDPVRIGDKGHDYAFTLSLAKTITEPDRKWIGTLTPFIEFLGTHDLDGITENRFQMTCTPGVRFNLGSKNWLLFGVDLPVVGPHLLDEAYRVTYINPF